MSHHDKRYRSEEISPGAGEAGEGEEDVVADSSCSLTVHLPSLDAKVSVTAWPASSNSTKRLKIFSNSAFIFQQEGRTEKDMNYNARNTAMAKDAVEVILEDNRDEKGHSSREGPY